MRASTLPAAHVTAPTAPASAARSRRWVRRRACDGRCSGIGAATYRHRTATFNSTDTFSSSARHGADTFVTVLTRCRDPSDLGETLPVPVRSKAPPVVAVVLAAGAGSRFRGPGHKLDAAV